WDRGAPAAAGAWVGEGGGCSATTVGPAASTAQGRLRGRPPGALAGGSVDGSGALCGAWCCAEPSLRGGALEDPRCVPRGDRGDDATEEPLTWRRPAPFRRPAC